MCPKYPHAQVQREGGAMTSGAEPGQTSCEGEITGDRFLRSLRGKSRRVGSEGAADDRLQWRHTRRT